MGNFESRQTAVAALVLALAMGNLGGCDLVIGLDDYERVDGNQPWSNGAGGMGGSTTSTTMSTTTTAASSGGAGGMGGYAGSGGTGAGPSCVDEIPQGAAITNADCDMLNVAPQFAVDCAAPDPVEGPGWRCCRWGVTNLTEGANEYLYERLSNIGVQDACLYEPVQTAFNDLYMAACASDSAVADCAEWQTQCGQPITQDVCAFRIGPLNTTARTVIVDCINNAPASDSCQQAFDTCVDNLTTDF